MTPEELEARIVELEKRVALLAQSIDGLWEGHAAMAWDQERLRIDAHTAGVTGQREVGPYDDATIKQVVAEVRQKVDAEFGPVKTER